MANLIPNADKCHEWNELACYSHIENVPAAFLYKPVLCDNTVLCTDLFSYLGWSTKLGRHLQELLWFPDDFHFWWVQTLVEVACWSCQRAIICLFVVRCPFRLCFGYTSTGRSIEAAGKWRLFFSKSDAMIGEILVVLVTCSHHLYSKCRE